MSLSFTKLLHNRQRPSRSNGFQSALFNKYTVLLWGGLKINHIYVYYTCTQFSNDLYNIITGSISTLVCNGQGCHLFTLKQHKGTTKNRHSELLVGGALMHVECVMLRVFSTVGLQRLFDYSHKKAKQQISMLLHSHFATTSCVKKQTS